MPGKWIVILQTDSGSVICVDSAIVKGVMQYIASTTSTSPQRTYIGSYSSNASKAGAGYIDSTGARYLVQFPNYDSECFTADGSFSNAGSDDSTQLYVFGNTYSLYTQTANTYLERAVVQTQWSSKDTSASIAAPALPPVGADSGYVVHVVNSGGLRYLSVLKHSRDDGIGFNLTAGGNKCVWREQLPSALFPSTGTSVTVRVQLRLRRKHI